MHDNWQFPKFPPIPIEIFSVPDVENSSSRPVSLYISYEKNYILDWKITCKSTFLKSNFPRNYLGKSQYRSVISLYRNLICEIKLIVFKICHILCVEKPWQKTWSCFFHFLRNEKWLKQLWIIVFLVDLVNFEAKFSRQLVWQQI